MHYSISCFVAALVLWSFASIEGTAVRKTPPQATQTSVTTEQKLLGKWHVKFTFAGREEKNLIFDSQPKGVGSFLLLDTAPDLKPENFAHPAAWALTTNDRFSFSAEVELPIGTCCREVGTLIFKGKFDSNSSLSGKVIFVGSTTDDETPIGFRSMVGIFTATRR